MIFPANLGRTLQGSRISILLISNHLTGPDISAPDAPAMRTIAYNSDNMPAQIAHSAHGTTTFTYDGGSSRAKKSGPSGSTYYVGGHFEVSGGSAKKYIFAGSQRVAMIDAGGQIYYFHSDHLGSSAVLTDPTGIKAQQTDYLPYGGQRGASSISASNYGFTNQEKDPETGLYNYNARLYDPATAVFVTADSIVPNPMSVMGFQRYGYCNGNPLIYTDPSGDYGVAETVYIAMAIAAVLGAGNAAAHGGDTDAIIGGAMTGAAMAAFSAGAYGVAGVACTGISNSVGQATIYMAIGAYAGGMMSAMTGQDIGQGALIGWRIVSGVFHARWALLRYQRHPIKAAASVCRPNGDRRHGRRHGCHHQRERPIRCLRHRSVGGGCIVSFYCIVSF
jgi:RHS repeat-associated protein